MFFKGIIDMTSNVYTKDEILNELSSKGYFIDTFTLDSFFEQWKIEAIYENEEGKEFFDKNSLDIVLNNLFENSKKEDSSDETPVENIELKQDEHVSMEIEETDISSEIVSIKDDNKEETVLENTNDEENNENEIINNEVNDNVEEVNNNDDNNEEDDDDDDDDLTKLQSEISSQQAEEEKLINDSIDAQDQIRDYVVNQLSKNNINIPQNRNEFKLDISERTLNIIAKTLAKKIVKYVGAIFTADAKAEAKYKEEVQKNEVLYNQIDDLKEQNKLYNLIYLIKCL